MDQPTTYSSRLKGGKIGIKGTEKLREPLLVPYRGGGEIPTGPDLTGALIWH
jgi:hypothetical protein